MEKDCYTCGYAGMFSEDSDGEATVDCEANELQMFAPVAEDGVCPHWEKASDDDDDE